MTRTPNLRGNGLAATLAELDSITESAFGPIPGESLDPSGTSMSLAEAAEIISDHDVFYAGHHSPERVREARRVVERGAFVREAAPSTPAPPGATVEEAHRQLASLAESRLGLPAEDARAHVAQVLLECQGLAGQAPDEQAVYLEHLTRRIRAYESLTPLVTASKAGGQ